MQDALKEHWPEYLMEAAELAAFMISASVFAILLYHPESPVTSTLSAEWIRRTLMGLAMGLTAMAIIYSPWGKRSGAHMNPAVTLTFLRLGKVAPWDAVFYVLAQFVGGIAGILAVSILAEKFLTHPSVNYVATLPGARGIGIAFFAELLISFILVTVVLAASNHERFARFTGMFAGLCVWMFILVESPFSGMSMNPARSFASAAPPLLWDALWIYFIAPPIGMLLAAEVHTRRKHQVRCAKLHHDSRVRCIFCEYQERTALRRGEPQSSEPETSLQEIRKESNATPTQST